MSDGLWIVVDAFPACFPYLCISSISLENNTDRDDRLKTEDQQSERLA